MDSCESEIDMASCGGMPVKFHPGKSFKFPNEFRDQKRCHWSINLVS